MHIRILATCSLSKRGGQDSEPSMMARRLWMPKCMGRNYETHSRILELSNISDTRWVILGALMEIVESGAWEAIEDGDKESMWIELKVCLPEECWYHERDWTIIWRSCIVFLNLECYKLLVLYTLITTLNIQESSRK